MTPRHISFSSDGKRFRYAIPPGLDPKQFKAAMMFRSQRRTLDTYMTQDEIDEMRRRSQIKFAEALLELPNINEAPTSAQLAMIGTTAGNIILHLAAEVDSLKALLKAKER